MTRICVGAALAIAAGSAQAGYTLQLDVNDIAIQAKDSGGANTAFGGVTHTGSLKLDDVSGTTILNEIAKSLGGPFVDQGFTGSLVDFDAEIVLSAGVVVGGSIFIEIDSGDTYSADIIPGFGDVDQDANGRYVIDGLTYHGLFSDAMFGNVDVSDWFAEQGAGDRLFGDFIEFKFLPDGTGFGYGDMDIFVTVPLPPAAYAGLGMLAGVAGLGYIRRRK